MPGQMDRLILLLRKIGRGDKERFGRLVLEPVGHMLIGEPFAALNVQSLALADDRIKGQPRGFAGQQFNDVHPELLRAVIEEGKAEILVPRLIFLVLRLGDARCPRHLRRGELHNLPQGADSLCNFQNLILHGRSLQKKSSLNQTKRPAPTLGRACFYQTSPRYHPQCADLRLSSELQQAPDL